MLKICGVTFVGGANYGSELQAYALRTAITNMDIDHERCSYDLLPVDKRAYSGPLIKRTKTRIRRALVWWARRKFRRFEKSWISFADAEHFQHLEKLNQKYDAFVCGSDVIWNPDFTRGYTFFYLEFAEKYAFSYAASLGKGKFTEAEQQMLKERIGKLRQISLREESGAALVRSLTGRPAVMMPDPVLLLDRKVWEETAGRRRRQGKYVFVYSTAPHLPSFEITMKAAEMTGLPVVVCKWAKNLGLQVRNGIYSFRAPEEWLALLRDAEYVFTNSFHATAFSVIFHRKFFTVAQGKREDGYNVRLYDFLDGMGLTDRIIPDVPAQLDTSEPDFTQADAAITSLRERGLNYIRENLTAALQEKRAREAAEAAPAPGKA